MGGGLNKKKSPLPLTLTTTAVIWQWLIFEVCAVWTKSTSPPTPHTLLPSKPCLNKIDYEYQLF